MAHGAPSVLTQMGLRPWNVRPGALAAAMLPAGTASTEAISEGIDATFGPEWPDETLWITAVDLDSGRRVVFGDDGAPTATVGQAVAASCAIPAFFQPVPIEKRRYVDGGTHSLVNLDLVARAGCDLVIVSSPMSTAGPVGVRKPSTVLRSLARAQLAREVATVRRAGAEVLAFQPTADDVRTIGLDAMDPDRRPVVVRSAYESTLRRLDRPDVQERLALLG